MIGSTAAIPPQGGHRYAVRVYYEDTDAGGIVYHASYLRFAERARTEAMRDLGVPHARLVEDCNLMFVVRRITADYLQPARLDEALTITTACLRLGHASVTLRQRFAGAGGLRAVLEVLLVCVNTQDGRPSRIPGLWYAAFAGMGGADAARAAGGR